MLFSATQKRATNSLKILQRIANNDRTAVKECLDAYGGVVWSLATTQTASIEEAEDAAQKIFLDLWQYAGRYDEKKCAESFFVALIAQRHLTERSKNVKQQTSKGKVIANKEMTTNGNRELSRVAVRHQIGKKRIVKINESVRVLYAEDNDDDSEMMTFLLALSAIEITRGKTVAEAWQTAQMGNFDLYLLDSRFPDGDGLDLCRRLREHTPNTPIVFYSGNAREIDKQNGLTAGANAYLVKPDFDNLASSILQLTGYGEIFKNDRNETNSDDLNDCVLFPDPESRYSKLEL